MFGLKGRQDGFRLLFPKEFLVKEVEEKYSKIIKSKLGYFDNPIDFLNETIQKVNVLGFQDGTMTQDQPVKGAEPTMKQNRIKQNQFQYAGSQFNYRSGVPPIQLTDKTFNITFRHTLGYLNYFMLFENFWYQFSRDMNYEDLPQRFTIDLFNELGSIYSRVSLFYPMINSMDMLEFDYTQPVAQSQTFNIEFKYSNFDFEFISIDELTNEFDRKFSD
jgi:hypothetical protein